VAASAGSLTCGTRGTRDLTLGRASQGALPSGVSGPDEEVKRVAEGVAGTGEAAPLAADSSQPLADSSLPVPDSSLLMPDSSLLGF
jgi:hypothetical protein